MVRCTYGYVTQSISKLCRAIEKYCLIDDIKQVFYCLKTAQCLGMIRKVFEAVCIEKVKFISQCDFISRQDGRLALLCSEMVTVGEELTNLPSTRDSDRASFAWYKNLFQHAKNTDLISSIPFWNGVQCARNDTNEINGKC